MYLYLSSVSSPVKEHKSICISGLIWGLNQTEDSNVHSWHMRSDGGCGRDYGGGPHHQ